MPFKSKVIYNCNDDYSKHLNILLNRLIGTRIQNEYKWTAKKSSQRLKTNQKKKQPSHSKYYAKIKNYEYSSTR